MNPGRDGFPRLLGDIGGTHARWAWQADDGAPLQAMTTHRCADHPSLLSSARQYLAEHGLPAPLWVGLGVATPVTGDEVRMTNHPWVFSVAALRDALGARRALAVNDFTALALSVPLLTADELWPLGGDAPVPGGAKAVLGPGTGLGVSGLVADGHGDWLPLAGEGGHVTLAAADDDDAQILAMLRARFGHVSAERVLSGPGLVHLYDVLCERDGVAAQPYAPPDVVAGAVLQRDAQCVAAARLFSGFLGNVAGNLALTLGARGGVYVGGGIVPRLGPGFDAALFRRRFEDKGRFAAYLQPVPIWLITTPTSPALRGVSRALDRLAA